MKRKIVDLSRPPDRVTRLRGVGPPGHFGAAMRLVGLAIVATGCAGGSSSPIDGLPRLDVTESARIVVQGDAAPLRIVEDLTLDTEGQIYLAERGERTVRVLAESGELRFQLGAGPDGVLRMSVPQRLEWEGDLLWVFDRARYHLTSFDGPNLVEQVLFSSLDLPDWEFPFVPVAPLPGRNALARPLIPQWVDGGRGAVEYPVLRVAPGSTVLDTLWMERVGAREVEVLWPDGGAPAPSPQPFDAEPLRAFDWSDGSMVEVTHRIDPEPRIVIERRGADGESIFRTELPFTPEPLSDDEVLRAVAHLSDDWAERRPGTLAEVRQLFRESLFIPPARRPFQAMVLAEDGGVWIRLTPSASDGGVGPVPPNEVGVPLDQLGGDAAGSRWLILSAGGAAHGWALLPPRFVPMWIDGARVVGVTTDDAGEHAILEVRVEGGA